MKFEVKNRWSGDVQFTAEIEADENTPLSIRRGLAVCWAFKAGANLAGANLDGANIARANLTGADLTGANLAGAHLTGANIAGANLARATYGKGIPLTRTPIYIGGLQWPVLILDEHIKIGCELHALSEWAEFDDRRILEMEGRTALKFWRQWKAPLLAMAKEKNEVSHAE